jgi:O-methyltransferase
MPYLTNFLKSFSEKRFRRQGLRGSFNWVGHANQFGKQDVKAALQLQRAGFATARLYGKLAELSNWLELPVIGDNVRALQLALVAEEIERDQLAGAVAELGVFRGSFSKIIRKVFPNRKLYLFDTFSGFDPEQAKHDQQNFSATMHDFRGTSIEQVSRTIGDVSLCEFRKGFFPDTAKGLEKEQFVFVSLDADLYQPTRDGLEFFFPRMVSGGAIMVHDFHARTYFGCQKAVREFCKTNQLRPVLLADSIVSALIVKP